MFTDPAVLPPTAYSRQAHEAPSHTRLDQRAHERFGRPPHSSAQVLLRRLLSSQNDYGHQERCETPIVGLTLPSPSLYMTTTVLGFKRQADCTMVKRYLNLICPVEVFLQGCIQVVATENVGCIWAVRSYHYLYTWHGCTFRVVFRVSKTEFQVNDATQAVNAATTIPRQAIAA